MPPNREQHRTPPPYRVCDSGADSFALVFRVPEGPLRDWDEAFGGQDISSKFQYRRAGLSVPPPGQQNASRAGLLLCRFFQAVISTRPVHSSDSLGTYSYPVPKATPAKRGRAYYPVS